MKKLIKFILLPTIILFFAYIPSFHAEEEVVKPYSSIQTEVNGTVSGLKDNPVGDYKIEYDTDALPCSVMLGGEKVQGIIKGIYKLFKIAAVVIVVVLSMLDFTKATAASDASAMKSATKKFTTRLIVLSALYLTPTILDLIISIVFGPNYFCGI